MSTSTFRVSAAIHSLLTLQLLVRDPEDAKLIVPLRHSKHFTKMKLQCLYHTEGKIDLRYIYNASSCHLHVPAEVSE